MHDSRLLAPRSEAGEARASWRLREGVTFRANARLKIAVGTAGEVQQESGPAARVDELGSSVFHYENTMRTRVLDASPIFGSRKRSQTG